MAERERKELPTSGEFAVWSDYIRTVEILRARIESKLHEDSELSGGDYKVLLELSEATGKTLRSSELAARMEWERSRLSGHLGRMERRGLVRREPCAEDARGSQVMLTAGGARAFRGATLPHLRAIKAYFVDAFDEEQLARIETQTTALRAHLGLDTPGPDTAFPGR